MAGAKGASLRAQLAALRKSIDAADDNIVRLLEERAALAKQVGEAKRAAGERVFAVPEREAEVLRRARRGGSLLKKRLPAIYREIISACLECEEPASAAYLGPQGTYSHEAALALMGAAARLRPVASIAAAVAEAETGRAQFAIVPFENSSAGTVRATMDSLARAPLFINAEHIMRIRHRLLVAQAGGKLQQIKEVFGHPQALEQCRRWLERNLPQAALRAESSSSAAAKRVAQAGGRRAAAIGSALAGQTQKLHTQAEDIEDFANNSTRFLMLAARQTRPTGKDKTSFIMATPHKAGAMFGVLRSLAKEGVNMTKLESRPVEGRLWEYSFFIDVEGHAQDAAVARALLGVRKHAASFKLLGSYPQAL